MAQYTISVFSELSDMLHQMGDYNLIRIVEAMSICRETGRPCAISPDGIMICIKNYHGSDIFGLVTNVNSEDFERASSDLSDEIIRYSKPRKKTA